MLFWFQVICLLVSLLTVFAYVEHHVYSKEHRLLPLFVGVIVVYDFYRILLYLTGDYGLFNQLENLLLLMIISVISYYAMDYLHIKMPHVLHVGLFLYLNILLIAIFLHFDTPEVYGMAFHLFTRFNALFVTMATVYALITKPFTHRTKWTNILMFVAICLPSIVGSTWSVESDGGHFAFLVVCFGSCLMILFLIFSNRLIAAGTLMQQNAFQKAGVAQFLLNEDRELIAANDKAMAIFADDPEIRDFEDVHKLFLVENELFLAKGFEAKDHEYRERIYECRENAVYQGRSLLGYLLVVDDVTEERNRVNRLKEERKQAELQTRLKGRMMANLSHDLRSPVHAIIGASDILMSSRTISAKNRTMIQYVRRAGNDLLDKVDQMLLYSKAEVGRLTLEEHGYSMEKLVQELMQMMLYHLQGRKVSCKARFLTPIPAEAIGDEERVREMLQNVLSNAIKATEEGEIVLELSCREEDREHWCYICQIRDTGRGMTKDQVDHIFEAYQTYAKSGEEGTGLGMPIVKQLCELMQGSCQVESTAGEGTCVTICFCHRKEGETMIRPTDIDNQKIVERIVNYTDEVRPDYVYPGARVLLADDLAINQKIFANLIQPWQVHLDMVENGLEAVNAVKEKYYDCVFLDYLMPEMDGLLAGEEIRQFSSVPLFLLTASDQEKMGAAAKEKGFDGFITKPIDRKRFKQLLEEVLPMEKQKVCISSGKQESHHLDVWIRAMETYCGEIRELRDKLPRYAEEDPELFRAKVHGIKSASRQMKKEYLAEYGEIFEMAAITENKSYIERHMSDLIAAMDEVLEEVSLELEYLKRTEDPKKEEGILMDPDKKRELWEELERGFLTYDTGAIEDQLAILRKICLDEEESRLLKRVEEYFLDFSYEEGEACLKEFLGHGK